MEFGLNYKGNRAYEEDEKIEMNRKLGEIHDFIEKCPYSNLIYSITEEGGVIRHIYTREGGEEYLLPLREKAHLCHLTYRLKTILGDDYFITHIHRKMLDEILEKIQNGKYCNQ